MSAVCKLRGLSLAVGLLEAFANAQQLLLAANGQTRGGNVGVGPVWEVNTRALQFGNADRSDGNGHRAARTGMDFPSGTEEVSDRLNGSFEVVRAWISANLLPALFKCSTVAIALNHWRGQQGRADRLGQNRFTQLKPVSKILFNLIFRCHRFQKT